MVKNDGFFIKDSTLDYVKMIGNTIQFSDYDNRYTSQSTGF